MKYKQITSNYIDDVIAEAMYAREIEFFHYEFDSINFIELLKTMPEGAEHNALQDRLNQTLLQMAYVDNIYDSLKMQITDEVAHQEAIIRTAEKRKNYVPTK